MRGQTRVSVSSEIRCQRDETTSQGTNSETRTL